MSSLSTVARCALLPLFLPLLVGCGSDPVPMRVCAPGASVACVGAGGCMGGQVCNAAGSGFAACECATPDAGPLDAGPMDGGPVDGDVADMDADGGPTGPCSPLTHAGCAAGERCTWVMIMSTPEEIGQLLCVPDGTVADGDACTRGPDGETTGYDNCARGLHCIDGACARVCDLAAPTSCGADSCTRYAGVFANGGDDPVAGACAASCDPVNQLRADGSSCPAGEGCYQIGAIFVCARVTGGAETRTHGVAITTPFPYANSCAPGHTAALAADGLSYICVAHCRPIETHSGATAGAAGQAPYSCPDRGAASPPHECLFLASLAYPESTDPRLDTVGVCFDPTGRTYDHDMNPGTAAVPIPSCTTLANTDTTGDGIADHLLFGCGPQPAP